MTVKITDNTGKIREGTFQQASLALRLMVDDIDCKSIARTPKALGDLRKNKIKTVVGLHRAIQWRQKYASKMENVQFQNYTTPGTGPDFAKDAVKEVTDNDTAYFKQAGLI